MKAILSILNTYHLGAAGEHVSEGIVDDVLQSKRQSELEALVARLARYKPTKILVEAIPARETELNTRYRAYLEGSHTLSRNEIEQIGFRLAKRLGHAKLYAVDDFNETGAKGLADNPFEKYQNNLELQQMQEEARVRNSQCQEILHREGLMALMAYLNRPDYMQSDHRIYLRLAQLGEEVVLWVQWWYGRNLKILLNILGVAEPNDRLLLIIGAGHGYLLRQMAQESGALRLRDIRRYL